MVFSVLIGLMMLVLASLCRAPLLLLAQGSDAARAVHGIGRRARKMAARMRMRPSGRVPGMVQGPP